MLHRKSINREKVGRENFDESLAVRQIRQSFPRKTFALYGIVSPHVSHIVHHWCSQPKSRTLYSCFMFVHAQPIYIYVVPELFLAKIVTYVLRLLFLKEY